MKVYIEIDEDELKRLVVDLLHVKLGEVAFKPSDVQIETKSAQNYKSTWETANFRARLEVHK